MATIEPERTLMSAPKWAWTTKCSCGKYIYKSRKDARKAAKVFHANDRLAAYLCTHPKAPDSAWHIGHLPKSVGEGASSRSQIRNLRRGDNDLCLREGRVNGTYGWKCNLEADHASRCLAQNALGEWLSLE